MTAHLPTLMLITGYAVFWLEMFVIRLPAGHTSFLASGLFLAVAAMIVLKERACLVPSTRHLSQMIVSLKPDQKFFLVSGLLISLVILGVAFCASLLPPHLAQETDALIYHITLARQHLLRHSFLHIPWSTADFYLLPLNFSLAPYWLVTELPNKFPQFIFFIATAWMAGRLAFRFCSGQLLPALLAVFAVLGLHAVGIQAGTAMLDVVMVYLLLAAFDSFLSGRFILAGVELAFYVWSKSFVPVQCLLIIVPLMMSGLIAAFRGWTFSWTPGQLFDSGQVGGYRRGLKATALVFVAGSFLIGGPFVVKSLYYTGTPLFPFFPGLVQTGPGINSDSPAWTSIVKKAAEVRATRDQYGSDRSPLEFAKHLWLIAVPEKGVNNRYDYPAGLMYLLFVVPFLVFWIRSLRRGEFSILPWFVIFFWMTWWAGSHQTRFLLVPLVLMLIIAAALIEKPSRILMGAVMIALALTGLSVVRAHKYDFGRKPLDVLRDKDRNLLMMSKTVEPGVEVPLDFTDAAFAEFPVNVSGKDSVFVLDH